MKVKKILLIGGIAAVGLGLVGGFPILAQWTAYAKQGLQNWADENTPMDQEIARLKNELPKLAEQENKIKNQLAKEIAQCEKLTREKTELAATVEREEKQTQALGEAIKASDTKKVSLGKGQEIDKDAALRKLDADTKTVATRKGELKVRTEALDKREETKSVLRAQLTELQSAREQLSAEISALEAEYQSLELKGMKVKGGAKDGGEVSKLRQGVSKVKDKMAEKRARYTLDEPAKDAAPAVSVDEMLERMASK